jgi:hypothetical protein
LWKVIYIRPPIILYDRYPVVTGRFKRVIAGCNILRLYIAASGICRRCPPLGRVPFFSETLCSGHPMLLRF